MISASIKKKKNKKCLVIGEIGAGKTTFLNLIFNRNMIERVNNNTQAQWFFGGDCESKRKKKGVSLTDFVTSRQDPIDPNFNWFDSPGLGDTRGMTYDLKHVTDIITTLRKLKEINCIVFMMNGQKDRLDPRTIAVLCHLYQYIPNKFLPNVVLVLTRTDHKTCGTFIDMLKANELFIFLESNVFVFENPIGDLLKNPCSLYSKERQNRIKEDMKGTRGELIKMLAFIKSKDSMKVEEFFELKKRIDGYKSLVDQLVVTANESEEQKQILNSAVGKTKKKKYR